MASEISGQNSSTIVSNFFKANTFNSGLGSSKREIIPAGNRTRHIKNKLFVSSQKWGYMISKAFYIQIIHIFPEKLIANAYICYYYYLCMIAVPEMYEIMENS